MTNIKINEVNYEISSCTESRTWNEGKANTMIFVDFANVEHKEHFDSLVGQNVNAVVLENEVPVLNIGEDYVLIETNRNIPFSSGFSVRFEKIEQ